jgi:hypothetical protein
MSINTKEIQKAFKRAKNYFEQEGMGYVISCACVKEKHPGHFSGTNLANIDAIIMLANALSTIVKQSYSEEVFDAFERSLDKSINEFRSIHRHNQLLKLELGGVA